MNYRAIRHILGRILMLISLLMILPMIVSLIYRESIRNLLAFLIPIVLLLLTGWLLTLGKNKDTSFGAREGFIIVGLAWILLSLFGCIPFIISKEIKNFFSAFFEITSGFTTTGSSCLTAEELESMSHSMLFWRSFSHWIGGMGILVFILAVIPESKDGSAVHILRAESPGPQVGKLVSKMQVTSRILYMIYIGLSLIEFLILIIIPDKRMGVFEAFIYTFGTAGTGGFATQAESVGYYSIASQYVIGSFMIIFGINFTIYYYLLIRNFKDIKRNEELKYFLFIVVLAVAIICSNIYSTYHSFEKAFRYSFFTVASIISTTGFANVNYISWPALSLIVITALTAFGACAGSTAGGIKTSRILILTKYQFSRIKLLVNPRRVETINLDGKPINKDVIESVRTFIIAYITILLLCTALIAIYNPNLNDNNPLTYLSSSLTCISNVGPGLTETVGPAGSFNGFSSFSKMILSFEMIAGRLEIFPILILFYPRAWKKRV